MLKYHGFDSCYDDCFLALFNAYDHTAGICVGSLVLSRYQPFPNAAIRTVLALNTPTIPKTLFLISKTTSYADKPLNYESLSPL